MFRTTSKNRTLLILSKGRLAPRALTLVEMLISMAVTLIMMAAVVNLFANLGAGVKTRNASMQLGTQLRLARARLFKDLAGATSAARPKLPSDDHDDGYLEIIEGQWSDRNPSGLLVGGTPGVDSLDRRLSIVPSSNLTLVAGEVTDGGGLGDYDDILALTVRSESEPFVGRLPVWQDPDGTGFRWVVTTIESDLAEVIWFAVENPADSSNGEPGMRTVYRRVLLIAPWVSELPPYVDTATTAKNTPLDQIYYHLSDVSFRQEGNLRVPNTLSDLTKRENRFAHISGAANFPHAIDISAIRLNPPTTRNRFPTVTNSVLHPFGLPFEWGPTNPDPLDPTVPPLVDRQGEDVMLNDVLAFDLRVYDPGAPILTNAAGLVLEPSDVGWGRPTIAIPTIANTVGYGAYVDLFWNKTGTTVPTGTNIPETLFEDVPKFKSGLNFSTTTLASVAYDTWPYHYENDGLDQDDTSGNDNVQDGDPLTGAVDEGTDGLDTNGTNGVDDSLERETAPPYDTPLRGMQVKIRVYDRDSRQIREATVTRNFVPNRDARRWFLGAG
ncbi:MAG: hypothetical protein GXP24_00520 [Planctomycetes bacterium]|nr:hypothetical protein [Planctomycetota bacterium]